MISFKAQSVIQQRFQQMQILRATEEATLYLVSARVDLESEPGQLQISCADSLTAQSLRWRYFWLTEFDIMKTYKSQYELASYT